MNYFRPSVLSIFYNPHFIIRNEIYKSLKNNSHYITGKVLDFGCGQKPYEHLFSVEKYLGMDVEISGHDHENSKIDIFYNGKDFPFEDNTFDSIICSEVIEHIFNLDLVLSEFYRVLKPNGTIILTFPFSFAEHEQPYDFARYTSFASISLFEKKEFTIIKFNKLNNAIGAIGQLFSDYLFKLSTRNKLLWLVIRGVFIPMNNVLTIVMSKILPKDKRLYTNNFLIVKK